MQRLARDFIIAIAGAVVGGVLLSLFTNLSRMQLVLVGFGILICCGLILAGLRLPGFVARRYQAFKAALVASTKEGVLAELAAAQLPQTKSPSASPGTILRTVKAQARADQRRSLADLAQRGRMLQGRVRYSNPTNTSVPAGLSSEIGDWEGQARTAIMHKAEWLADFDAAPSLGSLPTVGRTLTRMENQIGAVERAVREFEDASTSHLTEPTTLS